MMWLTRFIYNRAGKAHDDAGLWRICVHEAGHVLASGSISIPAVRIGRLTASTSIVVPDIMTPEANADLRRMYLAGLEAERILLPSMGLLSASDRAAWVEAASTHLYHDGFLYPGTTLTPAQAAHNDRRYQILLDADILRARVLLLANVESLKATALHLMERRRMDAAFIRLAKDHVIDAQPGVAAA